jgi:hypothetical protein
MSSTGPDALAALLRRRLAGGPLTVDVSGVSMGPRMVTGSKVDLVAADRPRWGEIWCVVADGGVLFVHRCVGWRRGRARFWGDGNDVVDDVVAPSSWVGRVVAVRSPDGAVRAVGARERWWWGSVAFVRHLGQYCAQWVRGRAASSSK